MYECMHTYTHKHKPTHLPRLTPTHPPIQTHILSSQQSPPCQLAPKTSPPLLTPTPRANGSAGIHFNRHYRLPVSDARSRGQPLLSNPPASVGCLRRLYLDVCPQVLWRPRVMLGWRALMLGWRALGLRCRAAGKSLGEAACGVCVHNTHACVRTRTRTRTRIRTRTRTRSGTGTGTGPGTGTGTHAHAHAHAPTRTQAHTHTHC